MSEGRVEVFGVSMAKSQGRLLDTKASGIANFFGYDDKSF